MHYPIMHGKTYSHTSSLEKHSSLKRYEAPSPSKSLPCLGVGGYLDGWLDSDFFPTQFFPSHPSFLFFRMKGCGTPYPYKCLHFFLHGIPRPSQWGPWQHTQIKDKIPSYSWWYLKACVQFYHQLAFGPSLPLNPPFRVDGPRYLKPFTQLFLGVCN